MKRDKRTIAVVSLIILVCSIVLFGFWIGNSRNPSVTEEAKLSNDKSAEDKAEEYANTSSTTNESQNDTDSQIQSNTTSSPQMPDQPETLEEYMQYFADYNSQSLTDIRTTQMLYEQYLQNPGPSAAITQSTLQALNQAKLKESINIVNIDTEINQLVLNGTLTNAEGTWLKEQVHRLRTP
jgi:FtsZ-interacting cell division protein ZipA